MAVGSKFFKYMASPKGRRFTFYGTTTALLCGFSIKYLPHSLLTDKHREIVALYENGIEKKVSQVLENRFIMALNSLKISGSERNYFTPFMVSGFDLYSFGSTKLLNGGFVGIPINFTYTAADEIPKGEVILKGYKKIEWNSPGGKLLQEGLILNEPEQIFGMCKEICECQTNKVLFNSLYLVAAILFYYGVTSTLNAKHQFFSRPLSLRIVLYFLVGIFTTGLYWTLKDGTQIWIDKSIDEHLASLGVTFLAAGVCYYDKVLKKNQAIRALTDSNEYTANGNHNHLIRTMTQPLTERKAFFEERFKKYIAEEKTKADANQNAN
ncbi:hypothetical protein PVAND_007839 [Polypedilum vanderplanki]|uniref:Transmembrane protein 177 n=1 Tax=Polypedilum vanderplanki TaxID=319348 RepID=A0A9J6C8E8_POLVA|nr:hypothetical protein PVAND_007839 [Polypedilum vanderplanki]